MKKATVLGALASASVLAASLSVHAAEWHEGPPALRFSGEPVAATRAFLTGHASSLRIEGIDLERRNVLALRSLSTVRYEQRHHGLPVFGKVVAVRVDPHGGIRTVAVDVARGLTVSTTPSIDEAQAVHAAAARLGRPLSLKQVGLQLGVLPYEARGGILVWYVDVMLSHGMHRYVVDAHAGAVIQDYSLARDAKGRVYAINPVSSPSLEDVELGDLDPATPAVLSGFGGGLKAYGYSSGDISYNKIQATQTEPSEGEDFLFDPNPEPSSLDDPFGEVMAYYHAARIRSYFEDTFGLDMSSSAYSLAVVSSYAPSSSPEYITNAFYSPWASGYESFPGYAKNIICLGRGQGEDFAHDSDVLLHEFTHYISNNALDYSDVGFWDEHGSAMMPGAINEGTADYFSSTLNDEPTVGEYALGYYARNLTESSGVCPDNVFGESHEDGKLIGTTGWALRVAFGAEIADQLMWGAMSLLGASASLGDFAQGVVQTATDLGLDAGQMAQLRGILAERGLDDCGRVLELKGKPRRTFLIGLEMVGQYMGADCATVKEYGIFMSSIFQFVYTPEPDDKSVEFAVQLDNAMGSGALDWNVYIRKDEMVTFDPGSGYEAPKVQDYDYAYEHLTTSDFSAVLSENSVPAFDTASSYYLVVWHQNCPATAAGVGAFGTTEPPADAGVDAPIEPDAAVPDAGVIDSGVIDSGVIDTGLIDAGVIDGGNDAPAELAQEVEPGGGCSCRTTGGTHAPWGAGVLALLAAVMLRRRSSGRD